MKRTNAYREMDKTPSSSNPQGMQKLKIVWMGKVCEDPLK